MKKLLVLLFSFVSAAAFSQHTSQQIASCEKKGQSNARISPQTQSLNTSDFIFQRCQWQVDPAVRFIRGNVCTYFIPGVSLSQLEFDLTDTLTVDSVKYHGSNITFNHISGDILQVNFPAALPAAQSDSVSVYYHGVPPSAGLGSFATGVHGSSNTPALWTLSEPYGAKDWWPCKQNLADKIDSIDVIVTCPAAYTAASNGLLTDNSVVSGMRTCTWKHRHPIAAYLVCFAVSDYFVYTDLVPYNGDTVKVINYVYPEDSDAAQGCTMNIPGQMQLYDTLFGEYPFADEKYGHAEFGWGGGMEHQTMTFLGGFSYEIMAHELGHHWFGDKVTTGSWHDIWLNEGFATYLSGLCYEHYAFNVYWMPFKRGQVNYITSLPDGSVYCPDTVNINRIFDSRLSYSKGAMVLHTLRWVIGDSAFYAGVQAYLNDPLLAYRFATTADLQQHLEAASGQNLSWYFNDWYYGEGYPSYSISWNQDAANLVSFTVNQTQSDPSVSFYELPIPIEFKDATHDTIIRFNHTFSGENFTVQLPFHADSLIFDPQLWIISANNQVNNVQQLSLDNSISLFPNPATDQLVIKTGNAFAGNAAGKIFDTRGRLVQKEDFLFTLTNSQHSIDISALNKGLYFMWIETEGKTYALKFVKQ